MTEPASASTSPSPLRGKAGAITMGLVGYLFFVEFVSGVLQGYYVPLISDLVEYLGIRDADFNWFEAAQLLLSALVVPVLAKLGDMIGHKKVLLISTVLTAGASWWLVFADSFWVFLAAWALQGFYVVWLPLEVALIFDRGRRSDTGASQTRRAAGYLVVALEAGAIVGALGGARVFAAFNENVTLTLMIPAIAVTVAFFVILFGVPESTPQPGRRLDTIGFVLLTIALLTVTSGLTFLRINGPATWWVYALMLLGLLLLYPFGRWVLRHPDPAIDLRVLRQPTMWPVQLTAGLVGISILGAQAPLSTFAGTDPANGFGLGLDAAERSYIIGAYLVAMIIGALLFPVVSRRFTPRLALIAASVTVGLGYLAFLVNNTTAVGVTLNMVVAGIGSGALVAALPAAAAAAAPLGQTGIATGLTNTTKTIGGAFASAVFAVVLVLAAGQAVTETASSLLGYLIVFAICGGAALVAATALLVVPRLAFGDVAAEPDAQPTTSVRP
ncbi:MFS transporter [Microcella sp.]|uniref:MFS transporter n=1 Tax=Microcella sp. TaxID=1913979 RepID=UPI00391BBC0B